MNLSRHVITLTAALLVSVAARPIYAQVRIAVVDLQRAITETEEGRTAFRRLTRLKARRQKAIDTAQEEVKQLQNRIKKQGELWNEETKRERLGEYQQKVAELQQLFMEAQQELATKEAQLTKRILDRMRGIIERVAQAEGYTFVAERSGVLWVPSSYDITDLVIQRYNSENPGGSSSSMGMRRRSSMGMN